MAAQGLMPYLEHLTKGFIFPGFGAKKEGFSYLMSSMAKA